MKQNGLGPYSFIIYRVSGYCYHHIYQDCLYNCPKGNSKANGYNPTVLFDAQIVHVQEAGYTVHGI